MKTILTGCAIAALAVGAAQAKPAYQVMRPADSTLTCEALSTEINTLNAEVVELNAKAAKKAKTGKALSRGLLSGLAQAAPMLGYAGGNSSMVGSIAGTVGQGMARQALADDAAKPDEPAAAPILPEQQRLTHLNGLYRAKLC